MTSNPGRSHRPPEKHAASLLEALDDETLLKRIAAGHEASFECLYRRYYRRLLRFLLRVTRQVELADEVLSDTMMTVWEKASTFAGRSRASTWITGIAMWNTLLMLWIATLVHLRSQQNPRREWPWNQEPTACRRRRQRAPHARRSIRV